MTKTSFQPQGWQEGRRLRAWEMKQQGWKQRDIASALGVSEGAVSQWMRRGREGGVEGLRHVSPPGASSRMPPWQRLALLEMLVLGAEAFGFRGAVWTGRRVVALIRHHLGLCYHPGHITRLLRRWGFTPQKPTRTARQADEQVIARWSQETWPALKKKLLLRAARLSA